MQNTRLDRVALVVIAAIFMIYALSKCSNCGKSKTAENSTDSTQVNPAVTQTTSTPAPAPVPVIEPTSNVPASLNGKLPLYVVMDSLKIRRGPSLDSVTIGILRKDVVAFYAGRSANPTTVKLEGKEYREPWVEIITVDGRKGWVYGAGVHFYRK